MPNVFTKASGRWLLGRIALAVALLLPTWPIEAAPPQVDAAFASAAALQQRGLFELAADEWLALLREHPDDRRVAEARYNLGLCRFQTGAFDEAAKYFRLVTDPERYPKVAEGALANLGLAQLNAARATMANDGAVQADVQSQLKAAAATLARTVETFPNGEQVGNARFYQGEALRLLGDFPKAVGAYEAVLIDGNAEPLHRQARIGLATAKLELGDLPAVEATLAPLVDDQSAPLLAAEASLLRGTARLKAEKHAEAAADYLRASQTDGFADADYAQERAAFSYYLANDTLQAAQAYDDLVSRFPQSPFAKAAELSAAKCWLLAGKTDQATERFRAIWQASPIASNAESAHWLVQSFLKQKQHDKALQVAQQAINTKPDEDLLAQLELDVADALLASPDQRVAAADAYEQLATRRPSHPQGITALFFAAQTAFQLEQSERAAKLAEQFTDRVANFGESHPLLPDARSLLAESSLRLGRFDEAVSGFESLIRQFSNDERTPEWKRKLARTLYQRGCNLTTQGNRDRANIDFRRIIAEQGDQELTTYALYGLASNQYAEGKMTECVTTLQKLLSTTSGGPQKEIHFLLATALYQLEKHAEALQQLDGLPDSTPEKLRLRGQCLAKLDRHQEAVAVYGQFLKKYPTHRIADQVLYDLAWLHRNAGHDQRAINSFESVVTDYPQSTLRADASLRAGELHLAAGRHQVASGRFAFTVEQAAGDANLHEQALHLLGWAAFNQEKYREAAEAFDKQCKDHPEGSLAVEGQLMLGESYFALESHQQALRVYQTGLAAESGRPELQVVALLHAGQAAGQLTQWQASLDWLNQAAKHPQAGPHANQIAYERAWAMHQLGRSDDAEPLFVEVADVAIGPLSARARFMQGELQFAAKQYEQAVRTFFKVAYGYGGVEAPVEFHPWQSESLFEAARCLEQLNQVDPTRKLTDKARALYEELVERFPESAKAEHARRRLQLLARR